MPIPTTLNTARHFTGLNTYADPGDMPPGALLQADNLLLRSGVAVSRPGIAGQWTTPHTSANYEVLPYVKADGTTEILTVSGTKLYRSPKGAAVPIEVTTDGNAPGAGNTLPAINAATTHLARMGGYAYLVDGNVGLIRTNLATGGVTTNLHTIADAPLTTLTHVILDPALFGDGSWGQAPVYGGGSELIQNGSFETLSGGNPTVWNRYGANADVKSASESRGGFSSAYDGYEAMQLDDIGEGVSQDFPAPQFSGATLANYHMTAAVHSQSAGQTILFRLLALDASNAQVGNVLTYNATVPTATSGSDWTVVTHDFVLSSITGVAKLRFQVESGPANSGGYTGAYVDAVSLKSAKDSITLSASGDSKPLKITATGVNINGQYVVKNFGNAPVDLSKVNVIAFPYVGLAQVGGKAIQPVLTLGLQGTSAAPDQGIKTIPTATFAPGGDYFYVDISTIDSAIRQVTQKIYLYFNGDLDATTTGFAAGVFEFGPIIAAGNLTVGAQYTWYVTEINSDGDATVTRVIESNPSPGGAAETPNGLNAEGMLQLSTLLSHRDAKTTNLGIYRRGGSFSDNIGRKVAVISVADDTITHTPDATLVTWNHNTGVFLDDVPDSLLNNVDPLIEGRDTPPGNGQAICAWQRRLWIAVGSALYASWTTDTGLEDALYFTYVNVQGDPNNAIKGFYANAGGQDNDPIVALIPYGTTLIVLKQRSVWRLDGYDANNFSLQSYLLGSGVGCIAPRAACVVMNHIWFLGADGVYQFDADTVDPQSVVIESLLVPRNPDGTPAISPAAFARCAMVQHDRRLLLFAPSTGSAVNNQVFVWDSRENGWTRWTGIGATSAGSLTSGTDSNDLFLAGEDGQLYAMTGHSDAATPTAPPAAITCGLTSRGFGQEGEDLSFWQTSQGVRYFARVNAPPGTVLTVGVSGDTLVYTNDAKSWTLPYALSANGPQDVRLKVPSRVRGKMVFANVSWASTSQVMCNAMSVGMAKEAVQE